MVAISQHGTSVLFTSHPQDGLVVYLYIPHNRRTPLQAEEALCPISIPRGSCGVQNLRKPSFSWNCYHYDVSELGVLLVEIDHYQHYEAQFNIKLYGNSLLGDKTL